MCFVSIVLFQLFLGTAKIMHTFNMQNKTKNDTPNFKDLLWNCLISLKFSEFVHEWANFILNLLSWVEVFFQVS